MATSATERQARDPSPPPGLRAESFRQIARGGFGDGHNSYAHSMAWFRGKLYVGTTRSNMCMLRLQSAYKDAPLLVWPVDCPVSLDELYKIDRRAQIWCHDPDTGTWDMVFRAPIVEGIDGGKVPREIGYRAMVVFQSPADSEPALYVSAWAPGRAPGGLILRSQDGAEFRPVTEYGILERPVSATRSLTVLRDRIYFSPTAQRGSDGSQQNTAGLPLVFESHDPGGGKWLPVNEPGFGDAGNLGIFTLTAHNDRLYAGTFNLAGYQVWASDCRGNPPYSWRKLLDAGAERGPLNQAVAAMRGFRDAIYVGSGIQGGGMDRVNGIGPAAAEIVRVNDDNSWDIVVGDPRDTTCGPKEPISGMRSGFGSLFCGYMWSLGEHDGWLYAGTYDWSVDMRWAKLEASPPSVRRLVELIGAEKIVSNQGGFDLWRSFDGENWLPVTRQGFGNPYNWGARNLLSTQHGLFVGTANAFGPRVAVRDGDGWRYEDNPDGGLEVWQGSMIPAKAAP